MKKLSLGFSYVNWVLIFQIPERSYVQGCRHCFKIIGLSIASGVTWCRKTEEELVQRMVIMKFENCRCEEIVSEKIEAEGSCTQVYDPEQGFLVEG